MPAQNSAGLADPGFSGPRSHQSLEQRFGRLANLHAQGQLGAIYRNFADQRPRNPRPSRQPRLQGKRGRLINTLGRNVLFSMQLGRLSWVAPEETLASQGMKLQDWFSEAEIQAPHFWQTWHLWDWQKVAGNAFHTASVGGNAEPTRPQPAKGILGDSWGFSGLGLQCRKPKIINHRLHRTNFGRFQDERPAPQTLRQSRRQL